MKIIIWIIFWALPIFLSASSTEFRLDGKIVPTYYHLDLFVDPKQDYFLGNVVIYYTVEIPQSNFSLHYYSAFIGIDSVYLNDQVECHEKNYNTETEIAQFECNQLPKAEFLFLNISFRGQFETNGKLGFYKNTYIRDGKETIILNTFFAPGYTRRAFPCFDEPSMKANFKLTITYPKTCVAITNTLDMRTECISDNFKKTYFKPTPVMSTHAVAICIIHSQSLKHVHTEKDDYSFNVYKLQGSDIRMIQYYSAILIKSIRICTNVSYTEMDYTQLDLIVLPELASVAKENWGLIYFREQFLLGDIPTALEEDSILIMLAKEIAHQWFGNYVTAYWWSDIWLSEGLATYYGYHTLSESLPSYEHDFDLKNKFVGECLNNRAFSADSQPTSFPLSRPENEINTKEQAISCYGDISSAKGASIIRMIRHLCGKENFRRGIADYLRSRKYGVVDSETLLNQLAKTAELNDFANKMNSWIYEAGFPLVIATLDVNETVVLRQKPFNKDVETQWWIPITYTTSSKKNFTFECSTWMQPNKEIRIDLNDESWIIFNLQVVGYYRVMYDSELLDMITRALMGNDINNIHTLNKAQLIYDTFNVAKLGEIPYSEAFKLADYLRNEIQYYPWLAACDVFSDLLVKVDHETQKLLKERIAEYMKKVISKRKHDIILGNGHIQKLRETLLLEWKCKLYKNECITYALEAFKEFKSSKPCIPPKKNRDLVFCYGLKYSDNPYKDYVFLLNLFDGTESFVLKMSILKSLGCISQKKINKCMKNLISNKQIISEEKYAKVIFDSLIANDQTAFNFTLKFFTEQSPIIQMMTKHSSVFVDALYKLAENLVADYQIELFRKLINTVSLSNNTKLELDRITEGNYKWKNYGIEIKQLLEKN